VTTTINATVNLFSRTFKASLNEYIFIEWIETKSSTWIATNIVVDRLYSKLLEYNHRDTLLETRKGRLFMVGHIEILFKKLDPNAVIPCYIHEGDSGLDLCSLHEYIIKPGECTMVETGLSAEVVSHGDLTSFTFEIQIRPRSGLAMKEGITIINSPATIDSSYRGSLTLPLTKITNGEYKLKVGERFAQAVVCPIFSSPMVSIQEVETLSSSIRGEQGFGSTGELYRLKTLHLRKYK